MFRLGPVATSGVGASDSMARAARSLASCLESDVERETALRVPMETEGLLAMLTCSSMDMSSACGCMGTLRSFVVIDRER